MKYPKFTRGNRTPEIFAGLVEDIATRELNFERTPLRRGVDPRSVDVARTCVAAYTGRVDDVQSSQKPTKRYRRDWETGILTTMHSLIVHAGEPKQAAIHQRYMHEQIVGAINSNLSKKVPERGKLAEYVFAGLLTRYAHPDMLAYLALPHHEENNDVAGHFDVGVIIRNPGGDWDTYHLQSKAMCFGLCGLGNDTSTQKLEEYKSRYHPEVQLVSSCCHLGADDSGTKLQNTARLLVREREGALAYDDIKLLDNVTDNLVFNMSFDLLPRGTAPLTSHSISPDDMAKLAAWRPEV